MYTSKRKGGSYASKEASLVAQDLKNVLQLVEQKRYREVAGKVGEIIRFARQNQNLLELEARALLFVTLPYLTKKLQGRPL